MVARIYPQEYFASNNEFKSGLKWGALIMLVGIIIGAIIVYLAGRKHAS